MTDLLKLAKHILKKGIDTERLVDPSGAGPLANVPLSFTPPEGATKALHFKPFGFDLPSDRLPPDPISNVLHTTQNALSIPATGGLLGGAKWFGNLFPRAAKALTPLTKALPVIGPAMNASSVYNRIRDADVEFENPFARAAVQSPLGAGLALGTIPGPPGVAVDSAYLLGDEADKYLSGLHSDRLGRSMMDSARMRFWQKALNDSDYINSPDPGMPGRFRESLSQEAKYQGGGLGPVDYIKKLFSGMSDNMREGMANKTDGVLRRATVQDMLDRANLENK